MSVTYPADPTKPYGERLEVTGVQPAYRAESTPDEPFVPVYARRGKARGGQGKIKTWMILAPVAALVLGGIGAMLVMNGEETTAPLAEPAATAPVLSTTPTATAAAPLTSAATPAPVVATPPVAREAAPLRRAVAPTARREAPRVQAAPAAAPRVVTPAPAPVVGPQPYTASPSTPALNTAPVTPTPAPAPPPVIVVEPLG